MIRKTQRTPVRGSRTRRRVVIASLAVGVVSIIGVATIANAYDGVRWKTRQAAQAGARTAEQCGTSGDSAATTSPDQAMTPYLTGVRASQFIQGATLLVEPSDLDTGAAFSRLRLMHDSFHINTVSIYNMEDWEPAGTTIRKDRFFDTLRRMDMRVSIRLEAYDSNRFAFSSSDVDSLTKHFADVLGYIADPTRRDLVAYLALNMPVDDPKVQQRLGGVRSTRFASVQPGYATAAVAAVRGTLAAHGAGQTAIYLSVFYGWDNSYPTPSYQAANADGYFVNSYSYPTGSPAGAGSSETTLINTPRLRTTMQLFTRQYGATAPVVVEYGFHTAASQPGSRSPNQTAGLVADDAAKRRALVATTRFYCTTYPGVRGTMYFGYNILKEEGNPPARLDFALSHNP